jgi:patatin-like phospholipase/acyl hydrolase
LKKILKLAQPEGKIFPYLYFDLICGTSTGGLIAILLAVLYLDIDTAIEVYAKLGKTIFANSWRKTRFWLKDAQFNHKILRQAVTDIVRQYGRGRTLMYEPESKYDRGCKVSHVVI